MYIYKSMKLNETLRLNRYEKPFSPFFCTENFVINQEQTMFSKNHLLYFHYVIVFTMLHAFSCAYIELRMHLGSWRALKELELLSATPGATLTLLSCSPNFPRASIHQYTHAKHEPILK